MSVWRASILFLGFSVSLLIGMTLFVVNGVSVPIISFFTTEEPQALPTDDNDTMLLPIVHESKLVVEKILPYSGEFSEDMTFDYVNDVLALFVRNEGADWISSVDIILYDNASQYRFFATRIPPNAAVLLLETHREPYRQIDLTGMDICIWTADIQAMTTPVFSVEIVGLDVIAVTNLTDQHQTDVFLYYKSNYIDSTCLLGGITHAERISSLMPYETVYLQPEFFNGTNSTVLCVK